MKPTPVNQVMCATCPFREGVDPKYQAHRNEVMLLSEASRICHSTGSNNAFHRRTGKPEAICRGARDYQQTIYYRMGILSAPTDAAWNALCAERGILPNQRHRK